MWPLIGELICNAKAHTHKLIVINARDLCQLLVGLMKMQMEATCRSPNELGRICR